jgi:hypothetical protein
VNELERAARITIIGDHVARSAKATDYGTLEEYGALLAEDVVWEVPPFPQSSIQVRPDGDVPTPSSARANEGSMALKAPGAARCTS